MKKINLENLNLRLPADKNFIEFANYAANSNIIALCKALFPDDRAIVLYGLENPMVPATSFTAGAIYYNGEIYAVDAFAYQNTVKMSFCIREVVTNVIYKSGDELPGYSEKKMFPIQHWDSEQPIEVLAWGNMIRLKALNNLSIYEGHLEGAIRCNPILKHLLMNIDIAIKNKTSNAAVEIQLPTKIRIPNQFLGYVTLLCEGISSGGEVVFQEEDNPPVLAPGSTSTGGVSVGIVAEKKYKLFALNYDYTYLYLAEAWVNNFSESSQGVTYKALHNYFSGKVSNQLSFNVYLNHQILAQL